MRKKILGILVMTMLISTAIPVMGFEGRTEKKTSALFDMQEDVTNCMPRDSEGSSTIFFDQLDQSQTTDNYKEIFFNDVSSELSLAQSFIPTLTNLTKVEIKIERKGNPTMTKFNFFIYASLSAWFPVASMQINTVSLGIGTYWLTCDFTDITVTPGQPYYIVVYPLDGTYDTMNYFAWRGANTNPYLGGDAYFNNGVQGWTYFTNVDFCFKTYGNPGGTNNPPNTPSQMSGPSSGNIGEVLTYISSATDPDGDNIKYGFDSNNDGVVEYWSSSYYPSGATYTLHVTFNNVGTYYLRLKAQDEHGAESGWSPAKTVTIGGGGNNPPNTPATPSGPMTGSIGASYSYSTSGTDPDNDQVKYCFDWGDGSANSWTSLVSSGNTGSASHSWSTSGTYQVKAFSEDEHGAQSGWSSTLTVTISANNPPHNPTCAYNKIKDELVVTATDPDGDQVKYGVDWDNDGTIDQWTSLISSGTEQSINCNGRKGTVGVIAEDEHGAQSDLVSVKSKTRSIEYLIFNWLFDRFIYRFPFLEKILKNLSNN